MIRFCTSRPSAKSERMSNFNGIDEGLDDAAFRRERPLGEGELFDPTVRMARRSASRAQLIRAARIMPGAGRGRYLKLDGYVKLAKASVRVGRMRNSLFSLV